MLPTERLDYSPISERQPLALPGGARLAVWVIVNVEEWDPEETMPRSSCPSGSYGRFNRTSSSGAAHGNGSIFISAASSTRGPMPLAQK